MKDLVKIGYYGDVVVTVKYRYRMDAEFEVPDGETQPTAAQVLECLQKTRYHDITDEEVLLVLSVDDISENYAGQIENDDEDE